MLCDVSRSLALAMPSFAWDRSAPLQGRNRSEGEWDKHSFMPVPSADALDGSDVLAGAGEVPMSPLWWHFGGTHHSYNRVSRPYLRREGSVLMMTWRPDTYWSEFMSQRERATAICKATDSCAMAKAMSMDHYVYQQHCTTIAVLLKS